MSECKCVYSMCVCAHWLLPPPHPYLSNGKICSLVPARPIVAYLCGFISERCRGPRGPHPAFIRYRMEGGVDRVDPDPSDVTTSFPQLHNWAVSKMNVCGHLNFKLIRKRSFDIKTYLNVPWNQHIKPEAISQLFNSWLTENWLGIIFIIDSLFKSF